MTPQIWAWILNQTPKNQEDQKPQTLRIEMKTCDIDAGVSSSFSVHDIANLLKNDMNNLNLQATAELINAETDRVNLYEDDDIKDVLMLKLL